MTAFLDIEIGGTSVQVDRILHYFSIIFSPIGFAVFLNLHVGPYLQSRAVNRFQGEGDDVTGSWAELQPATQEVRARQGVGSEHPINIRTTEMEDWITGGNWDVRENLYGATLTFPGGTPSPSVKEKVTTAQIGRNFPQTTPRPVLGMNERDLTYIMATMAFWIAEGARVL